jgi:hypothetical protein
LSAGGVYAPGEGKKDESIEFYEILKARLNSKKFDISALCGNFNARVSKQQIERILHTNGENFLNGNVKPLKMLLP